MRRLRRAALQAQVESRPATSSAVVPARTTGSEDSRDADAPLDLLARGRIGVDGPGALAAVRTALVECLSTSSPNEVEVVIAGADLAQRLFPGVECFTGYEIAGGPDEAIGRLEVELVHRRRLTEGDDAMADFATVVVRYPEEPLPFLVLVAEAVTAAQKGRLDAVLDGGANLGIGFVTLGAWEGLPTINLAEGGPVESTSADDRFRQLQGAHPPFLAAAEAAELLSVVAAGRGQAQASDDSPQGEPQAFEVKAVTAGPVHVEVLGTYRIVVSGREISTGLRAKARELLALLVLRPAGLRAEAVIDWLWPDADPKRGMQGFKTALSNLRKTLRDALGDSGTEVVERVGDRYTLVSSAFDCDLWGFKAALAEARDASSPDARTASLKRAAAAYRGDLVDGSYYEWAEPAREDLRRRVLDVLVKLAELQDADPEEAAATLERAIRIDPLRRGPVPPADVVAAARRPARRGSPHVPRAGGPAERAGRRSRRRDA